MTETPTTSTRQDYDAAGRLAAVDATVKQAAEEFDLTERRIFDALHVLDLLAASAYTVARTTSAGEKPPFDVVKRAQQRWAASDAETLRLAYDLVNKLGNRAAVL